MSRAASLSAHRNTIERRRKRELARSAVVAVERTIREQDIRAYAFVGISSDGRAFASWDTGAILPQWAFPATVEAALRRDMEESGVEEDWRPALPVKGSTEHGQ